MFDNRPHRLMIVTVLCALIGAGIFAWAKWQRRENDPRDIRAAIGSTTRLRPALKKAFAANDHFEKKKPPKPGDWLASHKEPGQTYQQWVAQRFNLPDRRRNVLYIQPMGVFPKNREHILSDLKEFGEIHFNTKVVVQKPIAVPKTITDRVNTGTRRKQLLSPDILKFLQKDLPRNAYCRIAVTMTDLYPDPKWNYVFGQASLRNRVGVYSFARYEPEFWGQKPGEGDKVQFLRRCLAVFAHEVGHMYGKMHCIYFECLMNGSNSLDESDRGTLHLCPVCMRKLHHAAKFDPAKRYAALAKFFEKKKLDKEAKWTAKRLAFLKEK